MWHSGSSILVGASRVFSCTMCNLVPPPGIEPGFPALGVQSLSHWTTHPHGHLLPLIVPRSGLPVGIVGLTLNEEDS